MNDNNPVSNRVYQKAGSPLKEEITLDIKGMIYTAPNLCIRLQ